MTSILITTFDIWEPHHTSNASDDLLALLLERVTIPQARILRRLPVDFQQAPELAIAHLGPQEPDTIVCCGMAEARTTLTVESGATWDGERLSTSVNLEELITDLPLTRISHDAGNFVCNYFYYSILNYLKSNAFRKSQCIFVHVPILNPDNCEALVLDFQTLLQRLGVLLTAN